MNQGRLLLGAALAAIVMAIGCGNPCNDFVCSQCDGDDAKLVCDALVLGDNSTACQDAIDADLVPSCR